MKAPTTLLFTPEEVAEQYPSFFERYPIPAELTAIGSVFKHNFTVQKKLLREFFPFGENGKVLVAQYTDAESVVSGAFPKCMDLFKGFFAHKGNMTGWINQVITNRITDTGEKFSKALIKKFSEGKGDLYYHVRDYLTNDFCEELPRLPLAKKHDLETIIQNFYSEVAQIKQMQVSMYLSVNPYDIANASTGKVQSCNSINGMHNNAPICACSSENMVILRLEDEKEELLGRCYISFSPDMRSFVVQPTYGYMKDTFVQDAKMWICYIINKKLGDAEWKEYNGATNINPGFVSSAKNANFYVDANSKIMFRPDYKDIPAMRVGDCNCLVCGKSSSSIACKSCVDNHLRMCNTCRGRYVAEHETECKHCAALRRECPNCGEMFRASHTEQVVCDKCDTVTCACVICGEQLSWHKQIGMADCNVVELLDGSMYAHTSCINRDGKNHICSCGMPKSRFDSACKYCLYKRLAKRDASRAIETISRLRKNLGWAKDTLNLQLNERLVLPEAYALAA